MATQLLDHMLYILMTNVDNDNSDKTYTNMHEVWGRLRAV